MTQVTKLSSVSQFIHTFLWPVKRWELKKVLPMLLMFFCIAFAHNILKSIKDTAIMAGEGSGAEAILFIKIWGVLPIAVLATLLYVKLSSILSKQALFYATLLPFLFFFALFALVLYPQRQLLLPHASANYLASLLPPGLQIMATISRNWTVSLFFIAAELWGSMVMSMLFWNFANEITHVDDAKRFYPLFNLGSIFSLLCAGPLGSYLSSLGKALALPHEDSWGFTLQYLIGFVIAAGLVFAYLYNWMNKHVLSDARFYVPREQEDKKDAKPKLSITESIRLITGSKYIGCIALLVICYGISINLVEITWKEQARLYYTNSNDLNAFFSDCMTITAFADFFLLLLGGYMIRKLPWKVTALAAPFILLITGGAFFTFVIFQDSSHASFLPLAVFWGAMQNILSKASKFSLFDPSKEVAYIPLDGELRVKGKAAVDIIGSRLGKSGGSLIQQGLIIALGSLQAIPPYAAGVMLVTITIWLAAVKSLSAQFQSLVQTSKAKTL